MKQEGKKRKKNLSIRFFSFDFHFLLSLLPLLKSYLLLLLLQVSWLQISPPPFFPWRVRCHWRFWRSVGGWFSPRCALSQGHTTRSTYPSVGNFRPFADASTTWMALDGTKGGGGDRTSKEKKEKDKGKELQINKKMHIMMKFSILLEDRIIFVFLELSFFRCLIFFSLLLFPMSCIWHSFSSAII